MQLYIGKILRTIIFACFFIFSSYTYALSYNEHADFSDIFIGYGNASADTKCLQDHLDNDDSSEIIELSTLNGEDYNKIRSLKMGSSDQDYNLNLEKGQNIAQKFLCRVCFLFLHNSTTEKYIIYNSKAEFNKELIGDEKEEAIKENEILPVHSCDSINNEQKYFILSIRQAILKIASNPVGRRSLCRIIKNIDTKKILIVQTKHDVAKGSFSFYQGLTARLKDAYVCVTVPWELEKSRYEKPGLGSVRDKTYKQLAIYVDKDSDLNDHSSVIGKKNTDTKPFYISLFHEFIHCMHFLENKMVDLDERESNKAMFSYIYKDCFWDKNVPILFNKMNLSYFFLTSRNKVFELSDDTKSLETPQTNTSYRLKELKMNIFVDNIFNWEGVENKGSIENKMIDVLFSELHCLIYNDDEIDKLSLKNLISIILPKYSEEWEAGRKALFDNFWEIKNLNDVKLNLLNRLFGMFISTYCISKLQDNHYFGDYLNGEEIYTVTGLRYENGKFVIDNVSELSFNALEENKVIRVSYSSFYDLKAIGLKEYTALKRATNEFKEHVQNGNARIDAIKLLKRLSGDAKFDILKEGEKLEDGLRKKILKKTEDGLCDFFDFL